MRESRAWKKKFNAFYADHPPPKHTLALPHVYFAAYRGGEIIAHSVIYRKRSKWMLDGLRVKPQWRERGIAKALTAARIRYAIKNGAKEIWYTCADENLVTICCHLVFGFQKASPRGRASAAAKIHHYRLKVSDELMKKLEK